MDADPGAADAKAIPRTEMVKRGIRYAWLVEKLAAIGVRDSEANLRNKISRSGFYWGVPDPMSNHDGRHLATARGLGLLVVAAILFAGSAWVWNIGATRIALSQRGYPIAAANCKGAKACEDKAQLDARTATTADTALYIALGQLVASLLGLGGVGYTVFYARQAWKEAERSANAAQEALDDTRQETAQQASRFESQLKVAADAAEASSKAATEMGRVADVMAENMEMVRSNMATLQAMSRRQMRAYLTANVGSAIYQERAKGLYFEGSPYILNTGNTPARNVRHRMKSAVMALDKIDAFTFPIDDPLSGGGTLNPGQTFIVGATMDAYVPDQDVALIKRAEGQALVTWGVVTYQDIFDDAHSLKVAVIYRWHPNGSIVGHWVNDQNDSD